MKKIAKYIYILSMFIISFGAALSIKANLGTSPIICIHYVISLISNLSVGTTSLIFSVILIILQIIILKSGFEKRQYRQIIMGLLFSAFIDFSLLILDFLNPTD